MKTPSAKDDGDLETDRDSSGLSLIQNKTSSHHLHHEHES